MPFAARLFAIVAIVEADDAALNLGLFLGSKEKRADSDEVAALGACSTTRQWRSGRCSM
jgi:hypothetical protein